MTRASPPTEAASMPTRTHFSTRAIRQELRHREWSKTGEPAIGEMFSAQPEDGFTAEVDSIRIGNVLLLFGWYGAQKICRSDSHIQRQPADVLCITIAGTMCLSGPAYTIRSGSIGLVDFSKPFEHHSTAGSLTSVVIPHALLTAAGIDVVPLHGMVFSSGHAAALRNYVAALRLIVEHVPRREEERVVRSIIDVLGLTILSAQGDLNRLTDTQKTLKSCAEQIITSQNDLDAIGPDDLCKSLGISRTRLYGLYREEGGVIVRLQRERLERARIALEVSTLSIGEIGYRFGFHQPAHFSRLFKQTYGQSPRSWRSRAFTD